jgi:CelD/BcsL family acetyltransferase involved in cellulose biosynthesis
LGKTSELNILFFWDGANSLVGIAPLMIKDDGLQFIASHEVTDYCDFIFSDKRREEFFYHLWYHIQGNMSRFSRAEFINIPASSPTLSSLTRLASGHGWECETLLSEVAPVLILPESYDGYLQSLDRKNRHELRRKLRKLGSLKDVHIERFADSERLGDALQEFISLHKASSPAKQEFWQKRGMTEFFSRMVHKFALENWAELLLLYVEGRTIAALLDFTNADTVYFYNIAFDSDYSAYSPGFFLFDHAIKQAIADGKAVVDFLRGQEKYKYFFGAKESKIYSLNLKRRDEKP